MALERRSAIPVLNRSVSEKEKERSILQKRKKKLLIRRLTVFFILFMMITISLLSALISQNRVLSEKQEQLHNLDEEYHNLKEEQKALKEEIVKFQDEEYVGKYARQEYFMSDEGEIIFTIPEDHEF